MLLSILSHQISFLIYESNNGLQQLKLVTAIISQKTFDTRWIIKLYKILCTHIEEETYRQVTNQQKKEGKDLEKPLTKMKIQFGYFPNQVQPSPCRNFWNFWGTFRRLMFFGTVWALFVSLFTKNVGGKLPKTFWFGWDSLVLPKIPKWLVHKMCPKTFKSAQNTPPPPL